MITFNTQEEFDSAVMAAVEKYLQINLYVYEDYGNVKVGVQLRDELTKTDFSQADDYCTVVSRDV